MERPFENGGSVASSGYWAIFKLLVKLNDSDGGLPQSGGLVFKFTL